MPDYRPIEDDYLEDFRRMADYAFQLPTGPYDPDGPVNERLRRRRSFGERRGLFEDGDLLVGCKHIDFETRVRGSWLPLACMSELAAAPEHRRQGHAGQLLVELLAEFHDRGRLLAALWPYDDSHYARYGWRVGCRDVYATVDTEALSVAEDAAAGSFERVDPDDHERLRPVYEAWTEGKQLATRRSDDWWRHRVFQAHAKELYGYCWTRDGDPRGYVVYGVGNGEDGLKMTAAEFAYADHEAYLNLLRFCHNHVSQVGQVELRGHSHDRLLDVVGNRNALEVEVQPGVMVRLVDVPAALEAVPYPGVGSTSVALAVEDDHAPWNDGVFEVAVADGEATVRETDADPDATVGVGTLSQLFVGYLPVERARRVGDLRIHAPAAAEALDAIFPEREAFMPERF